MIEGKILVENMSSEKFRTPFYKEIRLTWEFWFQRLLKEHSLLEESFWKREIKSQNY